MLNDFQEFMLRTNKPYRFLKIILIGAIVFTFCPFFYAQKNVVTLPSGDSIVFIDKNPWKFHSGDDMNWALPEWNDESWQTIKSTDFGTGKYKRSDLPKGWNGMGWFRIWIQKKNIQQTNTWGIYLNNDAASEVYLDGKKVGSIGKFGHSKAEMIAERQPFLTIPIAITDTKPHLLTIRYSNFFGYFPDFVGFNIKIGDQHTMDEQQKSYQRFCDYLMMSASAAGILIFLHLLLFIFYPQKRINLFYVLFVSVVAMGLFARYQTIVATDPALQVFYTKLFLSFVVSHLGFAVLLLYIAGQNRIPKFRLAAIGFITVITLIWVWNDWYDAFYNPTKVRFSNQFQLAFALLFFTDALIPIIRKARKGNRKFWLIAAGVILVLFLGIFVGSNQFGWFTFREVMFGFAWGNLILPLLFSIYIAMDVASTNRELSYKLIENQKLSAENISKEQEKLKLISEQAQELEKTVLERTAEVRSQADKLKEMDETKSRFFVNLTHEFKTPLTLILNPAKELLEISKNEAVRLQAKFILQNAKRLQTLINQLLDISKIENKEMEISYADVDVVKWLLAHTSQYESLAKSRELEIIFESSSDHLWLKTDLDKLEKIVQNLISNAIKFSHPKGKITITLIKNDDENFEISVKDEGIGISAEKLPHIFDRFYQVDASDTRSQEGIGIGLALVKELVDLLDGTIEVTSEKNIGTTFRVIFPIIPAENETSNVPFESSDSFDDFKNPDLIQHSDFSAKPLILLVEDNESLREFIEVSLQDFYHIILAKNGEEGVFKALETIPDLIITDLMMPIKNGFEVCEIIKNDHRTSHIPVIMLTAKADLESKIQGIDTGADAYLGKPFDKRELLATMENLIRQRKQLREKFSNEKNWFSQVDDLPSMDQVFIEKLRNILTDKMEDSSFGTENLAKEMGLSRTQLHRKLKDIINQSPGEFIRSIRMQKAHQLLENRIATVAETGYLVGYGNPGNFSTSFSAYFGYPPSEVGN